MKRKSKLDKKALQKFFIDHAEKLVFGVVIAVFLWFSYDSLGVVQSKYDKVPQNLQDLVRNANSQIDGGPKDPKELPDAMFPPPDHKDKLVGGEVPYDRYLFSTPFFRPVTKKSHFRDAPKLFPATKLAATVSRGGLTINGQGLGDNAGRRWVTLTALVPYQQQVAEFKRALGGTEGGDPMKDMVNYFGYFCQRAEVTAGAPPDWSKAKFIYFPYSVAEETQTWAAPPPELADLKFITPTLCMRLPPVDKPNILGREVVHEPEIPVLPLEKRQAGGMGGGFMPGGRGMGGEGGLMPRGGGMLPPRFREGYGGRDMSGVVTGGGGDDPFAEKRPVVEAKVDDTPPDWLLLRFIDLDVEVGKQYQYRVFLWHKNPNEGLAAKYLMSPEYAASRYLGITKVEIGADKKPVGVEIDPRISAWSQPSNMVSISDAMGVFALSVTGTRGVAKPEPEGKIAVTKWVERTGDKVSQECEPVLRGFVVNLPGCSVRVEAPVVRPAPAVREGGRAPRDMSAPGRGEGGRPGRRDRGPQARPTRIPVDFNTENLIVDMVGGEVMPGRGKLSRPGEMLVMEPGGTLKIHNEITDVADFEAYKRADDEEAAPPAIPAANGKKADAKADGKTDKKAAKKNDDLEATDKDLIGSGKGKGK